MKTKKLLLVAGVIWAGATLSLSAAFRLIDGFEAQEPGHLHGQQGWTSVGLTVIKEPGNLNNQVLSLSTAESEAFLPLPLPASQSTLFFRLRVVVDNADPTMPTLDWSIGLSSDPISNLPSQTQMGLELSQNRGPDNFYPKRIQARDDDFFLPLADLYPGIWYGIWIITLPWNNSYQVYMDGGQFVGPTPLTDVTGQYEFALLAGSTVGQLLRWHIRSGIDHAAPIYVDDLNLDTSGRNLSYPPPAPVNPRLEGLVPKDGTRFYPAEDGIGFVISTTTTNQIPTTKIQLTLNGLDVSSGLVIQGSASRRIVSYVGLATNELYHAQIAATDNLGRTTVLPLVFDTFIPSQTINLEAEHYNYGAGRFIGNPQLTDLPGPSSYVNRVAVEGIDVHIQPVLREHVYRPLDDTGTSLSRDAARTEYVTAGVGETELGPFEFGEWLNYTRAFPSNYYRVYARVRGDIHEPVSAQFETVSGNPNSTNQTAVPVGLFENLVTESTNYFYVPLADGLGNPIAIKLQGTPTLRITSRTANFRLNYLLFVPAQSAASNPPFLSSVYPRPNASGIMPDVTIDLALTDRDTQVNTNHIRLRFDEEEVTAALSTAKSGNTTTLKYQPPDFLNPGSSYRITFICGDTGNPSFITTNVWSFTVSTNFALLPATSAMPVTSGRLIGFTSRAIQAGAYPVLPDTIERAEDQLAGMLVYAGMPVLPVTQSLIQTPIVNFALPSNIVPPGSTTSSFTNHYYWPRMTNYTHNLATETVTYLALNRGSYRFGVYGDDSFRLTAGPAPHDLNLVIGTSQGSQPPAETQFDLLVETNGLYAFRLVWEQGMGGGNLEWYSVDRKTRTRTLINDTAAPVRILAFQYVLGLTNPVSIVQHPTNDIHAVNQQGMFSVQIANSGPLAAAPFYQWQSNQVNIEGANSPVYTTPPLTMADNGLKFRCVITVPGYRSLMSGEGTMTVVDDTNSPTIVQVAGSRKFDRVTLSYSEPVTPAGAENTANYQFIGGPAVLSARLDESGTNVFLTTTTQQENTSYTLVVNGITDLWGLPIVPNTKVRFTSFILANGFLTREIFEDVKGTDVEDLAGSDKFILDFYDRLAGVTSFETPVNEGVFYGERVCGYLMPPESGDYVFCLTAADTAELWLSKDEVLTNTALIARVLAPARPYQWTNEFNQVSGAITLLAGERYYVEVLHKAGATNDHTAVAWTLPSQSGRSNALLVIPGDYLSTYVNPDVADIVITLQPTNTTVPENRSATFTVAATGSSALGTNILYQWLKNGTAVPGATLPSHTTPPVTIADDGSRFQCAISVPGKTVFSAEAILTVSESVDLPPLFIIRKAQEAVIGWISTATNLVLESNTNLMTSLWLVAPETVVRDGNTNLVITPVIDDRFFRLRTP